MFSWGGQDLEVSLALNCISLQNQSFLHSPKAFYPVGANAIAERESDGMLYLQLHKVTIIFIIQ